MKPITGIVSTASFIFILLGCEPKWDEYYSKKPETIDKNVWEVISEDGSLSSFVHLMEDTRLDTIFQGYDTYTLFIPDDAAFDNYQLNDSVFNTADLLMYHISRHYIQSNYIQGKRKLQTMLEKYALYQREGNSTMYDGVEVIFESPLYENGKYFVLNQVAEPKENLFQYISKINPVFKNFIESQDSIIIDKELSKPVGFDEFGNIIYDTVAIIYNEFEEEYFPVREEFRAATATLVYPGPEQYRSGLTEMAQKLGGDFINHTDIPVQWQEEVLIPYLLHKGFFMNMLEPVEFEDPYPEDLYPHKLMNIQGDSTIIDYTPTGKVILSNGYAYDYTDFSVPDTLFMGTYTFEAEWLLDETGINKFDWYEDVSVSSTRSFAPLQEYISYASNDSIISVRFPNHYEGSFDLEFYTDAIFPADKYLVIVGTHMDIGGIYNVYVNDELVREAFDYYEYVIRRGILPSVAGGLYKPVERFNKFDFWVENHTDYGRVKIRFEYVGPGDISKQGLVIDHIDFVPY
jgi:uncharacterized surface protein with fasciclin (FAS1) repeats